MSATFVIERRISEEMDWVIHDEAMSHLLPAEGNPAPLESTTMWTVEEANPKPVAKDGFVEWHAHFLESGILHETFTADTKAGERVVYFMRVTPPVHVEKWLKRDFKRMKCRACNKSAKTILSLRGPDGIPFTTPPPSKEVGALDAFKEIESYCEDPLLVPALLRTDRIFIVNSPLITEEGTNPEFSHYAVQTANSTSPALDSTHIERVLHTYIPIVMRMFELHAVPGIFASLACLEAAMEKVSRAKTELGYGIEWFKDQVGEDFNQHSVQFKLSIVVSAIIKVLPTSTTDVEIPMIHQLKNTTFPMLVKCNSVGGLIGLMRNLFDVTTHKVPTAEPSLGTMLIGAAKLGNFTNTVMTIQQACGYGIVLCPVSTPSSSSSGVIAARIAAKRQELAGASARPKSAAGFASRSDYVFPTTLKALMDSMPSDLYVNMANTGKLILVETTLKEEARCVPFFHGVVNVNTLVRYPDDYRKVVGILKFGGVGAQPVRFGIVTENATVPPTNNSCCFQTFLSVSYNRTCRDAFQIHNTDMQLLGKTGPNLACGVYTSVHDDATALGTPITFRKGPTGTPFRISNSA